jgi:hypothetical protein
VLLDPRDRTKYIVETEFLYAMLSDVSLWRGLTKLKRPDLGAWVKSKAEPYRARWKKWRDGSLDYRMLVLYYFCMLALFWMKGALGVGMQLMLVSNLIAGFVQFSLWQRHALGWEWPGRPTLSQTHLWGMLGLPSLIAVFLVTFFPPTQPSWLPATSFVLAWLLFQALTVLGIVSASRDEFRQNCKERAEHVVRLSSHPAHPSPRHRRRARQKRITRVIYRVVFFLAWFEAVFFLYFYGFLLKGSKNSVSGQAGLVASHDLTEFMAPAHRQVLHQLRVTAFVSVPLIVASTLLFFHYVSRPELFPNSRSSKR